MRITAVRHGETTGNAAHIIQSHAPGELTQKGIAQAQSLGEQLKDIHFDAVYCSDLQRAIDTTAYILERHTVLPVVYTAMLRERSLGTLDGTAYDTVPRNLYDATQPDLRPPEGESWNDVIRRLKTLLNALYDKRSDAHMLIVSHGWTLRVMRYLLTDMTLAQTLVEVVDNASTQTWDMSAPLGSTL